MLEVISSQNSIFYQQVLQNMYRLRYLVFVERWGWDMETKKPGLDIDQFDNQRTLYLIRTDDDGTVSAACRFNPTLYPHLLSDVFPETCEPEGIPIGPDIYECSRLVIDEINLNKEERSEVMREMTYGITSFCNLTGISQITWLSHMAAYNYCSRIWPSKPLGLAKTYGNDLYRAAISEMNTEALDTTRQRARKIDTPVHYLVPMALRPNLLFSTTDYHPDLIVNL